MNPFVLFLLVFIAIFVSSTGSTPFGGTQKTKIGRDPSILVLVGKGHGKGGGNGNNKPILLTPGKGNKGGYNYSALPRVLQVALDNLNPVSIMKRIFREKEGRFNFFLLNPLKLFCINKYWQNKSLPYYIDRSKCKVEPPTNSLLFNRKPLLSRINMGKIHNNLASSGIIRGIREKKERELASKVSTPMSQVSTAASSTRFNSSWSPVSAVRRIDSFGTMSPVDSPAHDATFSRRSLAPTQFLTLTGESFSAAVIQLLKDSEDFGRNSDVIERTPTSDASSDQIDRAELLKKNDLIQKSSLVSLFQYLLLKTAKTEGTNPTLESTPEDQSYHQSKDHFKLRVYREGDPTAALPIPISGSDPTSLLRIPVSQSDIENNLSEFPYKLIKFLNSDLRKLFASAFQAKLNKLEQALSKYETTSLKRAASGLKRRPTRGESSLQASGVVKALQSSGVDPTTLVIAPTRTDDATEAKPNENEAKPSIRNDPRVLEKTEFADKIMKNNDFFNTQLQSFLREKFEEIEEKNQEIIIRYKGKVYEPLKSINGGAVNLMGEIQDGQIGTVSQPSFVLKKLVPQDMDEGFDLFANKLEGTESLYMANLESMQCGVDEEDTNAKKTSDGYHCFEVISGPSDPGPDFIFGLMEFAGKPVASLIEKTIPLTALDLHHLFHDLTHGLADIQKATKNTEFGAGSICPEKGCTLRDMHMQNLMAMESKDVAIKSKHRIEMERELMNTKLAREGTGEPQRRFYFKHIDMQIEKHTPLEVMRTAVGSYSDSDGNPTFCSALRRFTLDDSDTFIAGDVSKSSTLVDRSVSKAQLVKETLLEVACTDKLRRNSVDTTNEDAPSEEDTDTSRIEGDKNGKDPSGDALHLWEAYVEVLREKIRNHNLRTAGTFTGKLAGFVS